MYRLLVSLEEPGFFQTQKKLLKLVHYCLCQEERKWVYLLLLLSGFNNNRRCITAALYSLC